MLQYLKNVWSGLLLILTITQIVPQGNAQTIGNSGKIWLSGNYIYVNIVNEGVLIIDNQTPSSPKKVGFIQVPGNVDIAVRNNYMYANNFNDLITIDITNFSSPEIVHRNPNVFPHLGKTRSKEQEKISFRSTPNQTLASTRGDEIIVRDMPAQGGGGSSGGTTSGNSKGGSMACFTMVGNYLYTINNKDIHTFDISYQKKPKKMNKVHVGTRIETLFGNGNRLYIGSQMGMYIYGLENPKKPERLGRYRHTQSCDPVVVEGDRAYVTLHDGSDCRGGVNQLDILDISNPRFPRKIRTHSMTNPWGLGIDNGTLFICDGRDGLKTYKVNGHRGDIQLIKHEQNIRTYDVITVPSQKLLLMVGDNRLRQYSYQNLNKGITKVSEIDLQI